MKRLVFCMLLLAAPAFGHDRPISLAQKMEAKLLEVEATHSCGMMKEYADLIAPLPLDDPHYNSARKEYRRWADRCEAAIEQLIDIADK